ncbi:hypothetical protein JXA70_08690 [candidate division KSB1 bacterium]|nr:hypothetical protein [candidate division KSB1 bacterium]
MQAKEENPEYLFAKLKVEHDYEYAMFGKARNLIEMELNSDAPGELRRMGFLQLTIQGICKRPDGELPTV